MSVTNFTRAAALAAVMALSAPVAAHAGFFEARADEPGRYTMQPIEGGFLRLDTETGAVSVCKGENGDWACRPAADERSDLEEDNARLRAENEVLRAQIEDMGATPEVPTDEDIDAAMDTFEKVAERFGNIMKIMRREMEELDEEIRSGTETEETAPSDSATTE